MPSDTVWVAIVGGCVTVSSLGVQGWLTRSAEKRQSEREDRHRAEDKEWATAEARQEHYAELLRVAGQLTAEVEELMTWVVSNPADEHVAESWGSIRDLLSANLSVFTRPIVASPSGDVVEATSELKSVADAIVIWIEVEDWDELPDHADQLTRAHDRLRDAIRRDLGYDSPSPANRGSEP